MPIFAQFKQNLERKKKKEKSVAQISQHQANVFDLLDPRTPIIIIILSYKPRTYLFDKRRQIDSCEGCLLRWFQHHSIATAQSRSYLPRDHLDGEVPRDDGTANTDGLVASVAEVVAIWNIWKENRFNFNPLASMYFEV